MTSDINTYCVYSFHVTNFIFYFGILVKTLFGSLNFWTTFVLIELTKVSLHLSFSIFNISTFVQISLILNYEWVVEREDQVTFC